MSRLFAIGLVSLPLAAAAEPCAHFDLFPAEGVDLELVSALRARMERSGVASTGDLEDCPVRLAAAGDAVAVTVELEDRVVNRSFAREPPREAAWAIALLLEELSGVEGRPATEAPPPEEMIPTVQMPVSAPDLRPSPQVERSVRPEPHEILRLAAGFGGVVGFGGSAQRAAVEPFATSFEAAFAFPFLTDRIRLAARVDWYMKGRGGNVEFQSIQPSIAIPIEVVRLLRWSLFADPSLVIFRRVWIDPDPGNLSRERGPGFGVGARVEYRFLRWLGASTGLRLTYLFTQGLECSEPCYRSDPQNLFTTPWDVQAGVAAMIHF